MTIVEIVNVVATAALNQVIDFQHLKVHKEIVYNEDRYHGNVAYFKVDHMKGKVSIFKSGKMISVGTTSEAQACKELQTAKAFLSNKGLIKKVDIQPLTQNLVVTADFEQSINLEELSQRTRAIYEPEQFPGAILRLQQPVRTSILVFASGKIVITGLKDSKQIETVVERIKELIVE